MWVMASLAILLVAFFFIVQLSVVQTFMAQKTAAHFSKRLETNVYIEKLKIVFPLEVNIRNFGIDDRQGHPILRTHKMQLSLSSLSLKNRQVALNRIALDQPEFYLHTYQGDTTLNLQFIIDYFAGSQDVEKEPKPWSFKVYNVDISDAAFALRDFNFEPKPYGIDFKHLQLQELHLVLSDLVFESGELQLAMHHLSATERSGFVLNRLRAYASLTPEGIFMEDMIIQTPNSDILLDLAFLFSDFSAFNSFTDSVYIRADILPSELDFTDITFFATKTKGMDNKFAVSGQISGEVANLNLQNMAINYGRFTSFKGNILLDGLPDVRETFMHINARELTTHYRDLLSFKLPSENGSSFLEVPAEIRELGHVRVKSRFTGFYNDFVSDGTFLTNLGALTTDIALRYNFDTRDIVYAGKLETREFNIGQLTGQDQLLGLINMDATVDGSGKLPSSFDLQFAARISSFDFMGNKLDSLIVSGELIDKQFNGNLRLHDDLVQLDFLGLFDLNQDPPLFNFSAELKDAFLAKLNLFERDHSARLTTSLNLDFAGNNLDNLQGQIDIYDTWYFEDGHDVVMDRFSLNALPVTNGRRVLSLRSDFLDADFDGDFTYSQIYPAFREMLSYYLPSLRADESLASEPVPKQSFVSFIRLKNTQPLSRLFIPDIAINKDATIEVNFNSVHGTLGVYASAPDISLFGTSLRNWHFNLGARHEDLNIRTGASHLLIKEADRADTLELGLERLLINTSLSGDSVNYNISWIDQDLPRNNAGDLHGFLSFADSPRLKLKITDSDLVIDGVPWWFNKDHHIIIDTNSFTFNNFAFQSAGQQIRVDGKISSDPVEKINVFFEQWDVSNLDVILMAYGVDVDGFLNGHIELMELYDDPGLLANLSMEDFAFNQQKLGNLILNSSWDPFTRSVWVDTKIEYTGKVGTIIPFSLHGFYFPESEMENFDIEANLQSFRIEVFEPYLTGILSDLKGLASGKVFLKGSLADPDINGQISLMRSEFKVGFTNTRYSLADVINIEKNRIYANNIRVFDEFGNSGTASLQFSHQNFSDWRMDLDIQANNLAGLQTTAAQSNLFYGTAFATGTFKMAGPFNDLRMDVRVRSEPQTYIAIPISFTVDVADTDFIIFMNPEAGLEEIVLDEKEPSNLTVNIDMDITPEALVQIFLPYQMGNIRSSGTGSMKMHYSSAGDFTMFGDYMTGQGTFLFTLQNMINRPFSLLPGGVIRWSGDPYNAQIDVQAVYRTRVTLNSLPNISDEFHNRRYPVECIINLQNSLMNPEISFGIRMPNVDEEIQRQVFMAVDTTNEVIMSHQVISLLVVNSFNFRPEQTIASTIGSSSFELLSNQLNSWLSQISKDFDIGINYRPGDQLSSEELELALSTQLFDDRVVIDGNVGMIGEHRTQQNASNFIGDINVEIKITRDGRFRVRAFNKYNDFMEITRRDAPYTQGVGAFYRREFDRFPDLFKPRRKIPVKNDSLNNNNEPGNNTPDKDQTP